jgi:hypothetical protein
VLEGVFDLFSGLLDIGFRLISLASASSSSSSVTLPTASLPLPAASCAALWILSAPLMSSSSIRPYGSIGHLVQSA